MDGSTFLNWTTQSETNNLGWNIYRSHSQNLNQATQINYELIPGAGTTIEPTDYSYEDQYSFQPETTYWYWLESRSHDGETEIFEPITLTTPDEIEDPQTPDVPEVFGLNQNHPNPFNPDTYISFSLEEAGHSELRIFDIKGRTVKILFAGELETGELHRFMWDGEDQNGLVAPSGFYFFRLISGKYTSTKKMILLK